MPPSSKYSPADSQDKTDKQAATMGDDEYKARCEQCAYAWMYYDGDHKLPLKITEEGVDNNVVVNLVQKSVDRTVGFLFPDMPKVDLEPINKPSDSGSNRGGDNIPTGLNPTNRPENYKTSKMPGTGGEVDTERDPSEQYLDDVFEENGGLIVLLDSALNGCIAGHNYMRILPADDQHDFAQLIPLDPGCMITYWDMTNRKVVLWHQQHMKVNGKERKLDYINEAAGGGTGWTIKEWEKQGSHWVLLGSMPWAYPLGPIVDWKHLPAPRGYYGKSETTSLGLNDSANKIASDIKAILRTHASPRTVGTGMSVDELIATAIDNFWAVENAEAQIKNLEMNSDLHSSMAFLLYVTEEYMEENRVVVLKGNPDTFQNVTNLGIRTAFMDTTAKIKVLQRNYGQALKEIVKRLLMLAGKDWQTVKINITWPDPLPMSAMETTQVIQLQRDMSLISKQTARIELGLDNAQEEDRIAEEGDPALEAMTKLMQLPNGQESPQKASGGTGMPDMGKQRTSSPNKP